MNFNQLLTKFEEKIRLQYKYDLNKITNGEIMLFPTGMYQYDEIKISKETAGYLINQGNTTFEIYLFDKPFRKVNIWCVKRTGIPEEENFASIEDVLNWMNAAYIRDIKSKM